MKWFYDRKIGTKLLLGFIIVALIALAVGIIGVFNMSNSDREYNALFNDYGKPLADIGIVGIYFQQIRVNLRDIVLDSRNTNKNKNIDTLKKDNAVINTRLAAFKKSIRSQQVRGNYNQLEALLAKFQPMEERLIQLTLAGRNEEAYALMRGEALETANKIQGQIETLLNGKISTGDKKAGGLIDTTTHTIAYMIIIVIFGVIVAVALGLFLSRVISKPVTEMVDAATRIALGDVNVSVTSTTRDEIGHLMDAFARMIGNIREQAEIAERIADGDMTVEVKIRSDRDVLGQKLAQMVETNNEILGSIAVSSDQVSAGARQVSVSSQSLSQGSSEQASTVEEITASISQIATQTKENAMSAGQANELANLAQNNAVRGNDQMKEMLKAMEDINESSSNISKIIKVIDEIAFQTNILALNAAVEAARAGQHGKGFAVVAEEVRNLAARSADAAKETTAMIESSIKKVEIGTKIASETAAALDQIVDGVAKAAALVSNIANASNEQATAIAQINQGIEQVSQVIQANTATAEESASASEELSSQADMLKSMVSRFQLKSGSQSGDKLRGISPEMMRMLEDLIAKKGLGSVEAAAVREDTAPTAKKRKAKIALDDSDFGKY